MEDHIALFHGEVVGQGADATAALTAAIDAERITLQSVRNGLVDIYARRGTAVLEINVD